MRTTSRLRVGSETFWNFVAYIWGGVKRDMEIQSYGALVIVYSTMSESSRNFLYILFHLSVMKKSVENTALKIGV